MQKPLTVALLGLTDVNEPLREALRAAGLLLEGDPGASGLVAAVIDLGARDRDELIALARQCYGPLVGVPRILDLLERHQIASTFFVPGHTADRYPEAIRSIVAARHEIAHHGYLHEQPTALTPAIRDEGDLPCIGRQ